MDTLLAYDRKILDITQTPGLSTNVGAIIIDKVHSINEFSVASRQELLLRLKLVAENKIADCKRRAAELEKKIETVEDELNRYHVTQDDLQKKLKKHKANLEYNNTRLEELEKATASLNQDIQKVNQEIRKTEKKKKVTNILRWIPVVSIGSLVYEGIADNQGKIFRLQQEEKIIIHEIKLLEEDIKKCHGAIAMLEREQNNIEINIKSLQDKQRILQKEREAAKREMLEWQNRALYCGTMLAELDALIRRDATEEEIEKLLRENPPPVALGAV